MLTDLILLNEYDSVLEQRFRLEGPRSLGRPALEGEAGRGPQEDRAGLVGFISSPPVAGELIDWPAAPSAENRQVAHDLKKYSADSEEIGMNNKKTAAIFSHSSDLQSFPGQIAHCNGQYGW